MAAGNFTLYSDAKERIAKAEIDLDGHTFKALLCSSSYTPSASHSVIGDITNELASTGYARLTPTVTVAEAGGTVTIDCTDLTFGSAGNSYTAKYLVIYDDTHASDALLGYVDLDTGGGSVTGSYPFTITINASGLFTMA